jgi:hypothetical protein
MESADAPRYVRGKKDNSVTVSSAEEAAKFSGGRIKVNNSNGGKS